MLGDFITLNSLRNSPDGEKIALDVSPENMKDGLNNSVMLDSGTPHVAQFSTLKLIFTYRLARLSLTQLISMSFQCWYFRISMWNCLTYLNERRRVATIITIQRQKVTVRMYASMRGGRAKRWTGEIVGDDDRLSGKIWWNRHHYEKFT